MKLWQKSKIKLEKGIRLGIVALIFGMNKSKQGMRWLKMTWKRLFGRVSRLKFTKRCSINISSFGRISIGRWNSCSQNYLPCMSLVGHFTQVTDCSLPMSFRMRMDIIHWRNMKICKLTLATTSGKFLFIRWGWSVGHVIVSSGLLLMLGLVLLAWRCYSASKLSTHNKWLTVVQAKYIFRHSNAFLSNLSRLSMESKQVATTSKVSQIQGCSERNSVGYSIWSSVTFSG